MIDQLELPPADDFHLHVRDGKVTKSVLPAVARRFRRAIIMPNLKPPVTTTKLAAAYRNRILKVLDDDDNDNQKDNNNHNNNNNTNKFEPLMTLYLTDNTPPEEIYTAKASGIVFAVKLYPAGATTNSQSGVTDIKKVYPTLRAMAECGLPLLVHGEVTDSRVDLFDREAVFIERKFRPLVKAIPNLKIVMEHITTKEAADFVMSAPDNIAATITAHHLLYNRNAIFVGGVRPHFYCLPVLKTESDRQALLKAATSGNPKFFAGTDSAPHPIQNKERDCGSAGCYTSFAALELYAEAFDSVGKLDMLKDFVAVNGAAFYGLEANKGKGVVLQRRSWQVPKEYPLGDDKVVPLRANGKIKWSML